MESVPHAARPFNLRPMFLAALCFAAGSVSACFLVGAPGFAAACLLFIVGVAMLFLGRSTAALAFFSFAAGLLRMLAALPADIGCGEAFERFRYYGSEFYDADGGALRSHLAVLRDALCARCDLLFGAEAPLIKAVLLGERSSLEYLDSAAFRDAGAAHVLALSGLHLSVLSGAIALLIPKRRPLLRFCIVAAFMLVYCAIAALPSSLLRAAFITLSMLLAPVFDRRNDSASSLSLAFIAVALISPLRMFTAGFQLSFAAAAGIAMLYKPLSNLLSFLPDAPASALAVTASATAGTLPVTAHFFGRLSTYSLMSNLFIVPAASALLPLALVSLTVSFLHYPLGALLAFPARLFAALTRFLCGMFASLPGAVLSFDPPGVATVALAMLSLLFASRYCLLEKRKKYTVAALFLAAAATAALV